MKKVFLLSLGLLLGVAGFAQRQVVKNDMREGVASAKKALAGKEMVAYDNYAPQAMQSVVSTKYHDTDIVDLILTHYDLQSNHYVANRMYETPEGKVGVVATMSHQTSNSSVTDRGTGYNFFDGEDWLYQGDAVEDMVRIESFQTGWPSIAQWGENGEILLCHGGGHMNCFTREVAGEGEWNYRGTLPDYPEGYPYPSEYPTWPRVTTCGPNNSIIVAVACLQHQVSSDETHVHQIIWRSEDATNWTVDYSPLKDAGTDYHIDYFSADDYAVASNGNTVAILYSGCLTQSTWMFKSTDCGLTWNTVKVWEDPYEGISLEDPNLVYTDTLFRPMVGSIAVGDNGVVHVALNTFEMYHWADTEPGYYGYYYGRSVDGILYWNDTQVAPIQSEDGNPHHAARLWWPIPGEPDYVEMHNDTTKWIGMVPMFYDEDGNLIQWENDLYYNGDDYSQRCWAVSSFPALAVDEFGNLACAYSAPYTPKTDGDHYYRRIFVSYLNVDEGYWHQNDEYLQEDVFDLENSECIFTFAAPYAHTPGVYNFAFQDDDEIGLWWGSNNQQTGATDNYIHVMKVIAPNEYTGVEEQVAQDVVYEIYPNPATTYVVVKSAMSANATVTFTNLAGQTVKSFNKSLELGENSINIDLESGVYFMTVNANGFNKTTKVVVK